MTEFEFLKVQVLQLRILRTELEVYVSVVVAIVSVVPPLLPGLLHLKGRQSQKARLQYVDV